MKHYVELPGPVRLRVAYPVRYFALNLALVFGAGILALFVGLVAYGGF